MPGSQVSPGFSGEGEAVSRCQGHDRVTSERGVHEGTYSVGSKFERVLRPVMDWRSPQVVR